MRKLRIRLDDLKVESFDTGEGPAERRGTVRAHSSTNPTAGPTASEPILGCGSGFDTCKTQFEWSGCDFSCEFAPC